MFSLSLVKAVVQRAFLFVSHFVFEFTTSLTSFFAPSSLRGHGRGRGNA